MLTAASPGGKVKIFVSAYACEPGLGSEIGVGWHWIVEMSRTYRLWVLTRESNRPTIEAWLAAHDDEAAADVTFVYYDLPRRARFWKKGLRGVRVYYNLWQWLSAPIVRRTMEANGIGIFHHLTYGNAVWPVNSYGLRCKSVWGPIGGLETIGRDFTDRFDRPQRLREAMRRLLVSATRLSPGFHSRCRRADLILCKTGQTLAAIPAKYRRKAVLFTDVASEVEPVVPAAARGGDDTVMFILVGRLEAWRGFDLAIEAFALYLKQCRRPGILTIVGKGADKARLEALTRRLGVVDKVDFAGKVTPERYRQLMAAHDVVVNPSLKEGAVTVAFDAIAYGKPLIATDTTGYTRLLSAEYATVIPMTSRQEVVRAMAEAMTALADDATRERMGKAARGAARQLSWQRHGEEINALFKRLIDEPDR